MMMETLEQSEAQIAGLAKLREPFPSDWLSKLPKPTKKDNPKGRCDVCHGWHGLPAVHLDYVGHADITARLLDIDPLWNWEPLALTEEGLPKTSVKDGTASMWIKLTVCGVTRLGVGTAPASKEEVAKELIGDALRNAAMRFGAALDLWSKAERSEAADSEPEQKNRKQQEGKPRNAGRQEKQADPETGEVLEPLSKLIEGLNQDQRKELEARRQKSNFPALADITPAAEKAMRGWINELTKGDPF